MPVGTDYADVFATVAPRAPEAYATRPPADEADGPSFEDHLSAETDNERPVRETSAAHDDEPAPEESAPDPADNDPNAALIAQPSRTPPPAQPQQQPASQPALIQIIASLNAAAEQSADATAAAAETSAPTTPPPAAPPPIQNPNPQPQTGKAHTRKASAAEKAASANATAQPASAQQQAAGAEMPVVTATPDPTGEHTQQPPQQQGQPQTADAACAPPTNAGPQTPPPSANAQTQTQAPSVEPNAGTDAIGAVAPDQSAAKPADPGKSAAPPDFKVEPEQQAPQGQQNEAVQRAAPKRAANEAKSAAPQAKDAFSALLAQTTDAQAPRATSAPAQAPLTANTSATASASASAHAGVHTPANQVAREIIRRQTGGNTRFELRLDPPELGRVEVRLEVTRDQKVTAIVSADNPQALADLTRHARDLEQSLQSAGLELSENGLSFDLSQSRQGQQDENEATGVKSASDANAGEPETPQIVRASPLGLERWSGHRIDLVA